MGSTSVAPEELTAAEELIMQAIEEGSYFVWNEEPSGSINSSNKNFTLANTPNPSGSLRVYLNGARQKAGGEDFTLSGDAITFGHAPPTGSVLMVGYIVDPN